MERYKGKPFALLGVNVENDPAAVKRLQEAGTLTWPSFSGDVSEVALAYGVHTLPMVVLIDHKGIVREAWVDPKAEELDRKVNELVTAAEAGGSD